MTCVYDDKILKAPPAADESDRRIYLKRAGQSCSFPDWLDDSICFCKAKWRDVIVLICDILRVFQGEDDPTIRDKDIVKPSRIACFTD